MQYYFQIHYPDSNVASFPNHILYNFFSPRIICCIICHISLITFNLELFLHLSLSFRNNIDIFREYSTLHILKNISQVLFTAFPDN